MSTKMLVVACLFVADSDRVETQVISIVYEAVSYDFLSVTSVTARSLICTEGLPLALVTVSTLLKSVTKSGKVFSRPRSVMSHLIGQR